MAITQDEVQKIGNHDSSVNRRTIVGDALEVLNTWAQTYDELPLSRGEKARELLQCVGKVLEVQGVGYSLGSHRPRRARPRMESPAPGCGAQSPRVT